MKWISGFHSVVAVAVFVGATEADVIYSDDFDSSQELGDGIAVSTWANPTGAGNSGGNGLSESLLGGQFASFNFNLMIAPGFEVRIDSWSVDGFSQEGGPNLIDTIFVSGGPSPNLGVLAPIDNPHGVWHSLTSVTHGGVNLASDEHILTEGSYTVTLMTDMADQAGPVITSIDNFNLSGQIVPEPSSVVLFGCGTLAVALSRRKRSQSLGDT